MLVIIGIIAFLSFCWFRLKWRSSTEIFLGKIASKLNVARRLGAEMYDKGKNCAVNYSLYKDGSSYCIPFPNSSDDLYSFIAGFIDGTTDEEYAKEYFIAVIDLIMAKNVVPLYNPSDPIN